MSDLVKIHTSEETRKLIDELGHLTTKNVERRSSIENALVRLRTDERFTWLLKRYSKLIVSTHTGPNTKELGDPDAVIPPINVTNMAAQVGFMPYGKMFNEYQTKSEQAKKFYRKAARRFHPDLNAGNPDVAEKFRVAKLLYECGDSDGLKLLLIYDGYQLEEMSDPYSLDNLLMQRISTQRRVYDEMEDTIGFQILRLYVIGDRSPESAQNVVIKWLRRAYDIHLHKDYADFQEQLTEKVSSSATTD